MALPKPLKRIGAILRKEVVQTVRDWPTLLMILALPVGLLLIFASLGDVLMEHMPTVVADLSHDARSVAFVDALEVSGFFDVVGYAADEATVIEAIDTGDAMVGLVIPPDFAAEVERSTAQALILIDGSDSFVVQSSYNTASAIAQAHAMELVLETTERAGLRGFGRLPIYTALRILYNPSLDTLVFLIPGVTAFLLQTLTIAITALTVVREKELGTLEQILATPARPVEIIIGKMLPGVAVTALALALILFLGVAVYDVPFRGSVWLFLGLALVFMVSGLALGLLLSTLAKNQSQVQEMTMVVVLLGMLLTGLIYPRTTMPPLVQMVGNLIPATYFIRICRGIITKGLGVAFVWQDTAILAVYAVVAVAIAARAFRKRLD
jgi:ABC-2 type transport system permease protein